MTFLLIVKSHALKKMLKQVILFHLEALIITALLSVYHQIRQQKHILIG